MGLMIQIEEKENPDLYIKFDSLIKNKTKICPSCGIKKSIYDFYLRDRGKSRRMSKCKVCSLEQTRNISFLKWYKLTPEDWNKMFDAQDGKCLICGRHQSEFKRRFNVDHDHKTGEIRGLLCFNCNTGLGGFHDNVEFLEKAIQYLKNKKL
jgi:hypothetical protein